jgi:hypothetical protein
MCGRFTITVPAAEIAELMGLPELPAFAPRYNATQRYQRTTRLDESPSGDAEPRTR